jgi:hypothetical protein
MSASRVKDCCADADPRIGQSAGGAMPQIPIDSVQSGQLLEQPVSNASGIVLVRAGTTLTPSLIERLRDLGFTELSVRLSPGNGPAPELVAAIELRFRGHEQNALMMQIKDLLIRGAEPARG